MLDQLKTSPLSQDEQWIIAIKSGGLMRDEAIISLYSNHFDIVRTFVARLMEKHAGCKCEPEDIAHDAFILLLQKIQKNPTQHSCLRCFWFGIARNVWLNYLKKNKRIVLVEDEQVLYGNHDVTPEFLLLTKERNELMDEYLSRCGWRCREVLLMWVSHYSSQEIADRFHLSGPAMARKLKHKCFSKLKEMIRHENKL